MLKGIKIRVILQGLKARGEGRSTYRVVEGITARAVEGVRQRSSCDDDDDDDDDDDELMMMMMIEGY